MFFLLLTVLAIVLVYLQKYKYAFLLHIFIVTQGFRFFLAPQLQAFGVGFQYDDLSIIFIIFAYNEYFFRNHMHALHEQFNQSVILKLFKWFVVLIIIESLVDLFFNTVVVGDVLKANRKWLTLAVLPLYHYLKVKDIQWIIKAIVIVTLVQVVIVPLQPILHFEIPGSMRPDGFGGIRYGLMPYFWFLSFWYVYFTPQLKIKQKILLLLLITFVLFFAEARKNLLAIVVSILFFYSLKMTMKNIITSALVIALFCTLVVTFAPSDRIKEFGTDVGSIAETNLETYLHNREDPRYGTSAFRYYIFVERYEYLKKHPLKFLFGYGFVHEKNMIENPFSIMVSGIHALDTGDISWATLLVRYGMLGMIFMAVIVWVSIRCFMRQIDDDPLYKVGFTYMVTVLVLSFGDAFLMSPVVFLIPYMISILANPVTPVSQFQQDRREYFSNEKNNPYSVLS